MRRGPATACARGSSVSSIVCYLTGLSHIDPIANELFLGRFLNEELTALPDIDLDFPRDIREVLIPRVHERYGRERSALVAAFPTFRSRGAIRELGKVLGLPAVGVDDVAAARSSEAVRLLLERARAVRPGIADSDDAIRTAAGLNSAGSIRLPESTIANNANSPPAAAKRWRRSAFSRVNRALSRARSRTRPKFDNASPAVARLMRLRDKNRVGFNDGLIFPGHFFPLGSRQ